MTLRIEMLPACEGDCLLVRWGTPGDLHLMVIDGGRAATWKALKKRLGEMASDGVPAVDLLVISHVDRDHIEGILSLIADPDCPLPFKDIWFNGFHHLTDLEDYGAVQGESLSAALHAVPERWNKAFSHHSVCVERAATPIVLPGGLSLTLLSPSRPKLAAMVPVWEKECKAAGVVAGVAPVAPVVPPGLEALGAPNVAMLANSPFKDDDSPANGTSIAFLLSWGGRRVLLGADAHAGQIEASLAPLVAHGSRLRLDAFKVAHHGSQHNLSPALLEMLDCKRWLISSNGSYFHHPDPVAISRILVQGGGGAQLVFNYRSDESEVWDDGLLKSKYGYTTTWLAPGEAAVELEALPPELTAFGAPVADSVVVQLEAGANPDDLRNAIPAGWTLHTIPGLQDWMECLPPDGGIAAAMAWDLAYALRGLPGVSLAEPTLRVVDAGPVAAPKAAPEGIEPFGTDEDKPCDWSLDMVKARKAWEFSFDSGKVSRGWGVRVGHPDSGWLFHPEIDSQIDLPAMDFVDPAGNGKDTDGSGHGLGTASVIASPEDPQEGTYVTGIAPEARVFPLRVSRRHLGIPSPVLFEDGARHLRDALLALADLPKAERCGVVSISLGWFGDASLHAAVRRCVDKGIIVVAAAGNYTGPIVVWPAVYPETIACAGCDRHREAWWGSARGPAVDVTAPAARVWRAAPGGDVSPGSGTSYAAATVAGIAALWLAHHGETKLRGLYPGSLLPRVFAKVLCESAGPMPTASGVPLHDGNWGKGIPDAEACLRAPLPDPDTIEPFKAVADRHTLEGIATHASTGLDDLKAGFARVLGIPEGAVADALASHGPEILATILTDPEARGSLQPSAGGLEKLGGGEPGLTPRSLPMSASLRMRIGDLAV